jgi:hypothetical protein
MELHPALSAALTILLGAVAGLLVGILLVRWSPSSLYCPVLLYPVVWLAGLIADIFTPHDDYAVFVTFFPALTLYCAVIGAVVALTCRYFWRKVSAAHLTNR